MVVTNDADDTQDIMQDNRFFKSVATKRKDLLMEEGMFTTISLDNQTLLDFFVKHKKFHTKTDGQYSLYTLIQVNLETKRETGCYIILKLKQMMSKEKVDLLVRETEIKHKERAI
jgi:hypothetical protein